MLPLIESHQPHQPVCGGVLQVQASLGFGNLAQNCSPSYSMASQVGRCLLIPKVPEVPELVGSQQALAWSPEPDKQVSHQLLNTPAQS